MDQLIFNPPTGLRDQDIYPTDGTSESQVRDMLQQMPDQIKDFINSNFVNILADNNFAANGRYNLPGGFILQWGQVDFTSGGTQTWTFSKPFPTTCFYADGIVNYNAGWYGLTVDAKTNGTVNFRISSGSPVALVAFVFAFGY